MIRAPQDAGGGGILVALSLFALWQGADLPAGTVGHVGSGMLPRALAILAGACGLVLIAGAFVSEGPRLERWTWRGPLCVLGAAVAFGLAIRPLGLVVAGPLAIFIGAAADRDARWLEALVFGLAMTGFCVALFRYALNLPIPIAPWLIGS